MPPKKNVNVDVKNVDPTKLATGREAKKIILEQFPYENFYQKLERTFDILCFGAHRVSDERKAVKDIINKCLEAMKPFYSGEKHETSKSIKPEEFDNKMIGDLVTLSNTLINELPKAIDGYDKYLLGKDKQYKKNEGNYLDFAPNGNYIYRHVALDELKDMVETAKTINKNINFAYTQMSMGTLQSCTLEDIFDGREKTIKELTTTRGKVFKMRFEQQFDATINVIKKFAACGNPSAQKAYEKLKNIDISPYYKLEGGNYHVLKPDEINSLMILGDRIGAVAKEFFDEVGEDHKNMDSRHTPELSGYTGNTIQYKNNLVDAFKSIQDLSSQLGDLGKTKKHDGIYTLPAVLKFGDDDLFMGSNSYSYNIEQLQLAANAPLSANDKKTKEQGAAGVAVSQINQRCMVITKYINSFYEIGEDGYYKAIPASEIQTIRSKYEELEKAFAENEQAIRKNAPEAKMDAINKHLNNIKDTIASQKKALDKAIEQMSKVNAMSFDASNVILAEYIDPNPNVRKQMQQVREARINAAYDEAERLANSKFDSKNMDALEMLNTRLAMVQKDRFFTKEENVKACEGFFAKYNAMLGQLRELYARNESGGFTHYANDEERANLHQAFLDVQKEIKEVLKKKPLETTKTLLGSIDKEIETFAANIQGAEIYGTYPIAEFLDAGKFGYPSVQETRLAAYGYDRYDWNVNKEKNDQEWVSYEYYKNPIKKINHDISKLYSASTNEKYHYTDAEKNWISAVNDYVKNNFGDDFVGKYFKMVTKKDERLGVDVEHYPLMTKADQDALREKFHTLNDMLQQIGASEEFKNSQNRTVRSFLNGLATYTQQTEHRLRTFHSDLDMPLYTIQEATSGRSDTSAYNFRNDPENFKRIFDKYKKTQEMENNFTKQLQDAGLIIPEDQLWEAQPDENGHRVRQKEYGKQGVFSQIYTKFFNKNYQRDWEYKADLNDFFKILDKVKNFENRYFQCFEDGEYMELPITLAEIPPEGFEGPIETYEQLKYCYVQLQFQAYQLKEKFDEYNKKNGKTPLPASLGQALQDVHSKGLVLQTIISLEDSHRTKGDYMNVMELVHSDPDKRKNMWTIRQHRAFYNHRQEKGQLGTYRNLKHFESDYNSDMTYNGRFYDMTETPAKGDELDEYLEGVIAKIDAQASQEAKDFAQKLIDAAKDPDKASEYIPTIDELTAEGADFKEILNLAKEKLNLGNCEWNNEKDREMIKDVIRDLGAVGIDKYDHEQRTIRGAKYGENLVKHFEVLSKLSEQLSVDEEDAMPYQRVIPKTHERTLRVPGDQQGKTHTGMMVEAAPDRVGHIKGWDKYRKLEKQVAVNVITGKDLIGSTDPGLVSIDGFNANPKLIKSLASLQAICFLCNAPMPKFEDLKFAVVPGKDGVKEVQLMSHMPDPAFLDGDDYEGKINLEDMLVLPNDLGLQVKNIFAGDKKDNEKQASLQAFATRFTEGLFPDDSDAKKRIEKIIMKRAGEMSKYLNNKKLCKSGAVMTDEENGYCNGIKDKQILITEDFEHLTLDKLSLKPNIFEANPDGRKNIFTAFTNLPEKVYSNIRNQGLGDDDPVMKKAYVERFINGAKREAQALNIEETLAQLYDYHDETFVHSKFQKDSKEFVAMRDALKAIHTFETTGIIKYRENNQEKEIDINNLGLAGINGHGVEDIPDDIRKRIRKMYENASDKTTKYIEAKKGIIFNPVTDLGSRRYNAAKEISRKLENKISIMNKLIVRNPVKDTYEQFDKKAPNQKVREKINANGLAGEENANNAAKKVTGKQKANEAGKNNEKGKGKGKK